MQPPSPNEDENDDEFVTLYGWDAVSGDELGYPQFLNPNYYDDENENDNDNNQHQPRQHSRILQLLDEAHDYIYNTIMVDEKYRVVRDECYNDDEYCAYWAAEKGMCETHAEFMHFYCAPVCFSCHELHPATKCPVPENHATTLDAWQRAGDINRMFERIVAHDDIIAHYQPKVVSRPSYAPGDDDNARRRDVMVDYKIGPWIVVLENFVSDSEADFLIHFGQENGFERSRTKTGFMDEYGQAEYKESQGRTSTTTWCLDECATSAAAVAIFQRMQQLTGIPSNNSESLQLLHYDVGQFYQVHHDYIQHQELRIQGPRILTIFLYLNNVTDGGGTNFDHLDITVQPKRGRAVIWPSVLDYPPFAKDYRTTHQALAVIEGEKYGANAWFHMRDVRAAHERGCLMK
jgi:prolyl 4-hydroxylase